jgi:hypothetical protein
MRCWPQLAYVRRNQWRQLSGWSVTASNSAATASALSRLRSSTKPKVAHVSAKPGARSRAIRA